MPKIKSAGLTDVGRKRDHNEDSILVADDLGLYVVADGMGGHLAGEVASETAIKTIRSYIAGEYSNGSEGEVKPRTGLTPQEVKLYNAVSIANLDVCKMASSKSDYNGMGTTVVAVYVSRREVHIAHVGDSRVYRYRKGKLEAMTQDHSWVNEQVQRKLISEEEARNHRWRNVITRALGNREDIEVDLTSVKAEPGDAYLLCSDGLTGMVRDVAIANSMGIYDHDLEGACKDLIELANDAGGTDNISAVILRIEGA